MYYEKTWQERIKSFFTFAFFPLFVFTVVLLIPFIFGILATGTDWNGTSSILSFDFNFIGPENFKLALSDGKFWKILGFTFKYVGVVVILINVVAFSLSLLVTSKLKGKNVFRSVFFVPNLIGGVLLGFIWVFIFSKFTVYLGEMFGITAMQESWLVNPEKAFWAMVIVSVWKESGYVMLIYIAGLISVQKDVLEASEIDGAPYFQRLKSIIIPLMVPSITISLFLTIKNAFMSFDVNLALTGGGPFRTTELVTLHVYNEAFLFQNYGTGQAKAIILFFIVAIIAFTQVTLTNRLEK